MASEVVSTVPAAFAQRKPTLRRRFAGSAFWAMAMKELREVRGIAMAGLAAQVYLILAATRPDIFTTEGRGPDSEWLPFVYDNVFNGWFVMLSGAMAIALGLRQTLGESIHSTYLFLLHRPASSRWLIGMKMLVGIGTCSICSAVSIVGYGLWAATPGTHASPFKWSMTLPYWFYLFGIFGLYFGAFLSGIRPGRWLGTRLLPLLASLLMVPGMAVFVHGWCGVFFASVADFGMIVVILWVVRTREYS